MQHSRTATEEISLAEQCDAKGAHDDAIGALARATQLGNVEATTRLAKRLIVGDRAPLLPTDGTRFLVDAANQGGAEAAARLAVLAAAGAYVPPSLENALELLYAAADRDWGPAQDQLLALTPDRELASIATTVVGAVMPAREERSPWVRPSSSHNSRRKNHWPMPTPCGLIRTSRALEKLR